MRNMRNYVLKNITKEENRMDTILGLPAGKFIFEGIKTGISVIDLMSKKNEREHEHKLLINAIKKEDRPMYAYPPAPQGGYYYQPAPPQPVYYAAPAPQPAPQYYPPAPAYQPPAQPAYQQGGYYSGYYSQPAPPPAPTYQAPAPAPQAPPYSQPYYGYGYYGGSPTMSWLDRQREEAQWKSDYYKLKRENEDLKHECAYARAEGVLSARQRQALLPPPQTQQTPPVVINQPEINLDQLSTLTAQKLYDMHNKPEPDNT